ncbi:MAG: hypothetical protein ABI723_22225 [Bacteroidia bacterium]
MKNIGYGWYSAMYDLQYFRTSEPDSISIYNLYIPSGSFLTTLDSIFDYTYFGNKPPLYFLGDGSLFSPLSFALNKKAGRFKIYFENKSLAIEGKLKNDLPDDTMLIYNPNGQVLEERVYYKGRPTGTWRRFYATGTRQITIEFLSDSCRHWKAYDKTGNKIYDSYECDCPSEIYCQNPLHWKYENGEYLFIESIYERNLKLLRPGEDGYVSNIDTKN